MAEINGFGANYSNYNNNNNNVRLNKPTQVNEQANCCKEELVDNFIKENPELVVIEEPEPPTTKPNAFWGWFGNFFSWCNRIIGPATGPDNIGQSLGGEMSPEQLEKYMDRYSQI